jgi:hypothetical protein
MNYSDTVGVVCGDCGIEFRMSLVLYNLRYNDGKSWYCPNGHERCFQEGRERALRVAERNEVRRKLIAGVENWLKSFDEGNPAHEGPTIEDMRALLTEFKEREAALVRAQDEMNGKKR